VTLGTRGGDRWQPGAGARPGPASEPQPEPSQAREAPRRPPQRGGSRRGRPQRRRRRVPRWWLLAVAIALVATVAGTVFAVRRSGPHVDTAQFQPSHSLVTPAGYVYRTPVRTTRTLRYGGLRRSYLVVAPKTGTAGLPLLVDLAGSATTPGEELRRSGFGPLAGTGQAVLVFPAATGPAMYQSWNDGAGCCQSASADHVDDVGFVLDVVKTLEEQLRVDPGEVYLEGYSNGAKLAFTVACQDPSVFAAVAVYGGTPQLACRDTRVPVSLFLGVGSLDTETPVAGAAPNAIGNHLPLATVVHDWLTLDRCRPSAVTDHVANATLQIYRDCAAWTSVEYVIWKGQTHQWPRAPGLPQAATAATLMWQFFQHQGRLTG
jgi:polyhydroxybutyrate depolymerase